MNIQEIPTKELKDDLAASVADIKICELALLHNITEYGGSCSTQERLKVNQKIVAKIKEELKRRGL